jgi:P27 family predicted phage terminase small subunit
MARGRRPLPSTIKNLRGNPGKRQINTNEPVSQPGDPTMPTGLSDAAQKKWHELLDVLRPMRVLTIADGLNLAAICYTFDVWMSANEDVKTLGVMAKVPVMGRKGTLEEKEVIGWIVKKNPAVAVANEALKTMKSYMVEVGLTPASRSKLHIEKEKPVDPADAYFEKKQPRHVN